jgi:hypothetical protein
VKSRKRGVGSSTATRCYPRHVEPGWCRLEAYGHATAYRTYHGGTRDREGFALNDHCDAPANIVILFFLSFFGCRMESCLAGF